MAGLSRPIVVEDTAPSGFIRQRWVFSLEGHRLILDRYSYERRRSKKAEFKVTKFYDRGREPDEDYGNWTWLSEEEVPWDDALEGEALAKLVERVVVGRKSDFA